MNHTQPGLGLPNPQDWLDIGQTINMLGVNRSTIYVMIADGRLTDYRIGVSRVFWRAQVTELAAALRLARPRT